VLSHDLLNFEHANHPKTRYQLVIRKKGDAGIASFTQRSEIVSQWFGASCLHYLQLTGDKAFVHCKGNRLIVEPSSESEGLLGLLVE